MDVRKTRRDRGRTPECYVEGRKGGGLNSWSHKKFAGGCELLDHSFRTNLIRRLANLASNSDWEGGPVAWEHRSVVEQKY